MAIKSLQRCPICTGNFAQPYVKKDGYKFLKCSCAYIFCHPRPTQVELDKHYGVGETSEVLARTSLVIFTPRLLHGDDVPFLMPLSFYRMSGASVLWTSAVGVVL
jgi:hypothetical protein